MPFGTKTRTYRKTKKVLQNRWPAVLRAVEKLEKSGDFVDTPEPTVKADGIQVSSGFDQGREARIQLEIVEEPADQLWIYGVGSGVIVEEALAKYPDAEINVVVMNPGVFAKVLRLRDQTDWLTERSVNLKLGHRLGGFEEPFVVSPGSVALSIPAAYRLRDVIYIKLNDDYNSRVLEERYHPRTWSYSYIEKIKDLQKADRLLEQQEWSTAVVAGAGPTLEENPAKIQRRQENGAKVIAVDTALKPLLDMGIKPDICAVLDPGEANMSRFDFDLSMLGDTPLVVIPFVHERLMDVWPGPIYTGKSRGGWPDLPGEISWLNDLPEFYVGGSVVHLAVDLAVQGGAEKLYLTGADFAYPEGKHYTNGVVQEAGESKSLGDTSPDMRIKNGYGEIIATEFSFCRYCRNLEEYIQKNQEVEFVNLSKKGAEIRGTVYED